MEIVALSLIFGQLHELHETERIEKSTYEVQTEICKPHIQLTRFLHDLAQWITSSLVNHLELRSVETI